MFSLSVAFTVILTGDVVYCCYSMVEEYLIPNGVSWENAVHYEVIQSAIVLAIPLIAWYLLAIANAYEYFGVVKIQDDCLEFHAIFHRPRRLYYCDLQSIGIDYGMLSLTRQFWIYFSKEKIPPKYIHRINRLKFSKTTMRVQYNKNIFAALVYYTPSDISKRIRKGYSIIRMYHEDEDEYQRSPSC